MSIALICCVLLVPAVTRAEAADDWPQLRLGKAIKVTGIKLIPSTLRQILAFPCDEYMQDPLHASVLPEGIEAEFVLAPNGISIAVVTCDNIVPLSVVFAKSQHNYWQLRFVIGNTLSGFYSADNLGGTEIDSVTATIRTIFSSDVCSSDSMVEEYTYTLKSRLSNPDIYALTRVREAPGCVAGEWKTVWEIAPVELR